MRVVRGISRMDITTMNNDWVFQLLTALLFIATAIFIMLGATGHLPPGWW